MAEHECHMEWITKNPYSYWTCTIGEHCVTWLDVVVSEGLDWPLPRMLHKLKALLWSCSPPWFVGCQYMGDFSPEVQWIKHYKEVFNSTFSCLPKSGPPLQTNNLLTGSACYNGKVYLTCRPLPDFSTDMWMQQIYLSSRSQRLWVCLAWCMWWQPKAVLFSQWGAKRSSPSF